MSRVRLSGLLAAMALVGAMCAIPANPALADGDPGSDVLVYQPLFLPGDADVPVARQVALSRLLRSGAGSGTPIRVAVISSKADLGAVTALWRKPQAYARFLGIELSLAYKGELLVVMPNGFGINWPGRHLAASLRALGSITIKPGGTGLAAAAQTAVVKLASVRGVELTPTTSGSSASASGASTGGGADDSGRGSSAAGSGQATDTTVAICAMAAIAVGLAGAIVLRRHRVVFGRLLAVGRRRARGLAPALGSAAVAAATVGLVIAGARSSGDTATALASNPNVDPGTNLSGRPAPDFTLANQFGHSVSLSSFRGKVTILDFNDSECTTICPLTTTAMLEAKRMLGAAAAHVQLLGVDANPKATAIEDVLSYTQLHGLLGKWDFVTGSSAQLKAVWRAYGVEAEIHRGLISHTPALFIIDQQGRMRKLYMTQQSYSAVGQLAQILAREVSRLLPSHPTVHSRLSYEAQPTIPPTRSTRLPRSGGGSVPLGPGRPHLYLFFDTWDREVTSLAGHLETLNAYATSAARLGLPALTAVDEAAVEPSSQALPRFLKRLPAAVRYPVAIDRTGRVGDGYQVQGQPWMVLTSASGRILWYRAVYTAGWLSAQELRQEIRAALAHPPQTATGASAAQQSLLGSPTPLAKLHQQSSRLLGPQTQLMQRIHGLRGYPIVVNIWASWCGPCQAEFNLFASASVRFGRQVAFLGADTDDTTSDASAFLAQHRVSYPSYTATSSRLRDLVTGGIQGFPTTVFIDREGQVTAVHTGEYQAEGSLDSDIQTQALNPSR